MEPAEVFHGIFCCVALVSGWNVVGTVVPEGNPAGCDFCGE